MDNKPSSFSTICTSNCAFELVGLLLSLSIFHTNETIYILTDSKTKKIIDEMTPQPKLNIKWFIELDKYDGMNRQTMTRNNIFGDFLKNKMKIMNYALKDFQDTLLLDSDIIITGIINDIDKKKEVGLSPQYINTTDIDKSGYYNAGMLWCRSETVLNTWKNSINNFHDCPEQINMKELKMYPHFEFGENYNLQCWRYYLSPEGTQQISNNITSIPNDTIYYKKQPLKFVHTHFLDQRFKSFNDNIIQHLNNAKMYKILAIIFRVINKKWILKIPKQPMNGMGRHNNDSYRELPLLMNLKNKDVDFIYSDKTIHCWLEPNILTYDRPTLEWCNYEIQNASLMLLGNGNIEVEGKQIKNKLQHMNIMPWIFWPRKPMLVEKLLHKHPLLNYSERTIESIFIGNFENNVQEKFRKTNTGWENVLDEYHCTKGQTHKFTHEEYLMKLSQSKYGLCLRGYGSKCHREVELMAFGTVPIITPEVSIKSYMNPPIENVHYITANAPEELKAKISGIEEKKWNEMSKACSKWYFENVHSVNCWNNMIENILYNSEN